MDIETEKINQRDSNGLRQGYWKYYYDGLLQGYWKYYNNRRSHHEGNYIDGLRQGYWKHYYDIGIVRSENHMNYVNSIIEGEVIYGY